MNYLSRNRLITALLTTQVIMFSAIGSAQEALFVYAGAGLRPAVEKVTDLFEQRTSIKIVIDYAGSGQSLTRIRASQKGDVFIPGSSIYLDKLKATDGLGPVYTIALHTPVIGVHNSKAHLIHEFNDLAQPGLRIGLGDPKSMALGRTAEEILGASGIDDAVRANTKVYGATVKQLTLYLTQGDIDAAIISRSDAIQLSSKITKIDIPTNWYTPEIIAAGVLSTSKQPELADQLAQFFMSAESIGIFTKAGFLPYTKAP